MYYWPWKVLTKDSVTVSVDAVVYYRVNNATISIANVENAHHSTRLLAQTTLRNTMGTRPLHEILSERETISTNMQVDIIYTYQYLHWIYCLIYLTNRQIIIIYSKIILLKCLFRRHWMKLRIHGELKLNVLKCTNQYRYK